MSIILRNWYSPLGEITIGAIDDKICLLLWDNHARREHIVDRVSRLSCRKFCYGKSAAADAAVEQLEAYFSGKGVKLDIPMALHGTDFQRVVWEQMKLVPYGYTCTYASLSDACNLPHGARAVAQACAQNPINIIIPCHRIIGARGELSGYAGGIDRKRTLLTLERALISYTNTPT